MGVINKMCLGLYVDVCVSACVRYILCMFVCVYVTL